MIAILGAGAWGTALAVSLAQRHTVNLWMRSPDLAAALHAARENKRYLPEVTLAPTIRFYTELDEALLGVNLIIVTVPTHGFRAVIKSLAQHKLRIPIVWACKGFESESAKLPHQIVAEELIPGIPCGVLSGPSFALEVAQGLPTAITLASNHAACVEAAITRLHSNRLRVYSNDDVIGVELGGAVKNVMAIAAGISDGMRFGHNARAALITRGLAEIIRLGEKLGGKRDTFMGLAGAGDLILTATGDLSRNRRVGILLAEGQSLASILANLGHTAEGVNSAKAVLRLAQAQGVDMPITQAVCQVLFEGLEPKVAVEGLLNRVSKAEA